MIMINILLLFTTLVFHKLTSENFTAKLKQANLASKHAFANFVKRTDFDNKLKNVTSSKNELNDQSFLKECKIY